MTVDDLKSIISYCPNTGQVVRTVAAGAAPAGAVVTTLDRYGYRIIKIKYKTYLVHRLAWLYMTGEWPKEIDHVNRDRADNRWANLRQVTHADNQLNRNIQKNNKSGFRGVWAHRGKFYASIQRFGKKRHLGVFETAEAASCAYELAFRNLAKLEATDGK